MARPAPSFSPWRASRKQVLQAREFKSELDLERLPSGKFDTNCLVCQLVALTMNILRLMGQRVLLGPDAPLRHPAKRRRIKTVMQELIYRAGRIVEHARSFVLGWAPTIAPRPCLPGCTANCVVRTRQMSRPTH